MKYIKLLIIERGEMRPCLKNQASIEKIIVGKNYHKAKNTSETSCCQLRGRHDSLLNRRLNIIPETTRQDQLTNK